MTKAPLKEMKERFGTKEELVKQLLDRLEKKADEKRDDFMKRLMRVSNGKLLRLYKVTETVYGKFGSKTDLVERLLKLERPTAKKEDSPFKNALLRQTHAKLLDRFSALEKRAKKA